MPRGHGADVADSREARRNDDAEARGRGVADEASELPRVRRREASVNVNDYSEEAIMARTDIPEGWPKGPAAEVIAANDELIRRQAWLFFGWDEAGQA